MPKSGDGDLWPTTDDDDKQGDTPSGTPGDKPDDKSPAKSEDAVTHQLPVPDQQESAEASWFDPPSADEPAQERDETRPRPAQQRTQPVSWPVAELERQLTDPDAKATSRPLPQPSRKEEATAAVNHPKPSDGAPAWPAVEASRPSREDPPKPTQPSPADQAEPDGSWFGPQGDDKTSPRPTEGGADPGDAQDAGGAQKKGAQGDRESASGSWFTGPGDQATSSDKQPKNQPAGRLAANGTPPTQAQPTQAESHQAGTTSAQSAQVESTQAESHQAETAPAQSAQGESAQVESAQAQSNQAETAPAQSTQDESAQAQYSQAASIQAQSSEAGVAQVEPDEAEDAQVEPGEAGFTQAQSGEAGSTQAESGQAASAQAQSGEAGSTQAESGQAASAQAQSGETGSTQAESGQAASAQAQSSETGSAQAQSGNAASAQAESSRAASTQAESSQAQPNRTQSGRSESDRPASPGSATVYLPKPIQPGDAPPGTKPVQPGDESTKSTQSSDASPKSAQPGDALSTASGSPSSTKSAQSGDGPSTTRSAQPSGASAESARPSASPSAAESDQLSDPSTKLAQSGGSPSGIKPAQSSEASTSAQSRDTSSPAKPARPSGTSSTAKSAPPSDTSADKPRQSADAPTSFIRLRPPSQDSAPPSFVRPSQDTPSGLVRPKQDGGPPSRARPGQDNTPQGLVRPRQDSYPPGPVRPSKDSAPPNLVRPSQSGPPNLLRPSHDSSAPPRPNLDAPTSFIRPAQPPSRTTDSATVNLARPDRLNEWPPPEPPRAAPKRVGPPPEEPRAPRKRRPLLIAAVAIVAVIGLAAGVVFGVPGIAEKLGLTSEDTVAIDPPPGPIAYTPGLHGPDTAAPTPTEQGVASALAGPMANSALGTITGTVIDPATGKTLYERDAGKAITPASTGKLLTAAAALLSLDHTQQLATKVVQGDQPGEVIIVGGGDPTISSLKDGTESVYPGAAHLSDLVDQVKNSGVQVQTVYIDESRYAEPKLAPSWLPADIGAGYIAPIVPAMLDGGRQDATVNYSSRATDPGRALVDEFAGRLGAAIPGSVEKKAPANAKVLGEIRSAPVSQLVDNMLDHSDNTLGDILAHEVAVKAGQEPSFEGASKAVLDVLRQNNFDVEGAVLRDGSGMSTEDEVSAKLLAQILAAAAGADGKDPRTAKLRPLLGGLPVAGGSGTLAGRYTQGAATEGKGWVRAKTGTLTGVNSLAGIVLDKDNRPLVFAFLTSGTIGPTARPALDTVAAALRGCGCQ